MAIGYKLLAEAYDPRELVRQAVRAEEVGFDFVEVSDHFLPWLPEHGHSPFAWSVLAAAAMRTERIGLATGVTCPFMRYHPAIVAQAAATTAVLADGRFSLGVGAGERLNEHVVGGGWPSVRVRHEMLREALEIIRLLWQGGSQSYAGKHLTLEDARLYDLPDVPPEIAVAISGPKSARIAAELGDAIFATEPKPELTQAYADAGAPERGTPRFPWPSRPTSRRAPSPPIGCSGSASSAGRCRPTCRTWRATTPPPRSSPRTTCATSSRAGVTSSASSRSPGSSSTRASTASRSSTRARTSTGSSTSSRRSWPSRSASCSAPELGAG